MNLPLYSLPGGGTHLSSLPRQANTGLWYDKFCNCWRRQGGIWTLKTEDNSRENPKLNWIATVAGRRVGDGKLLEEACGRQAGLLRCLQKGARPLPFRTEWRFVTGLGREHPVENGFAWHHTLGVPYLPGSSVKGLVRNWAVQWAGGGKDIVRIFGPDGRNEPKPKRMAAGSVIFLDALPTEPVRLEADVMTPHYSEYYAQGKAPGDWLSPNPIPFLVVAAKQPFQFVVAPVPGTGTGKRDAALAREWLRDALCHIGAGAKTAVGYGVFAEGTGSAGGDQREEIWEDAVLRLNPGSGEITATHEGKRAIANISDTETVRRYRDGLSGAKRKRLNSGDVKETVVVEKTANRYLLVRIGQGGG